MVYLTSISAASTLWFCADTGFRRRHLFILLSRRRLDCILQSGKTQEGSFERWQSGGRLRTTYILRRDVDAAGDHRCGAPQLRSGHRFGKGRLFAEATDEY
jgi:hypothetical protein